MQDSIYTNEYACAHCGSRNPDHDCACWHDEHWCPECYANNQYDDVAFETIESA